MAFFNLTIEQFYLENLKVGKNVKGIFCIQYPIYCIHANIEDTTTDPLDNLDNIIVSFLTENPKYTIIQLAALIGASKSMVEYRIKTLIQDRFVLLKDKSHVITPLGLGIFNSKEKTRSCKLPGSSPI